MVWELDLTELLEKSAAAQPVQRAGVAGEVYDFIAERLRGLLLEESGPPRKCWTRFLANRPRSPTSMRSRACRLEGFLLLPEAGFWPHQQAHCQYSEEEDSLEHMSNVNPDALTEAAERTLHQVLADLRAPVRKAAEKRRYSDSLRSLVALRAPVDDFFGAPWCIDENNERPITDSLCCGRSGLLYFQPVSVADLSRLPGETAAVQWFNARCCSRFYDGLCLPVRDGHGAVLLAALRHAVRHRPHLGTHRIVDARAPVRPESTSWRAGSAFRGGTTSS